jgi:hypothetical protein
MPKTRFPILALALLAAGCGTATTRPVAFPSADVPCPGGRLSWDLQILDQRADRESTERAVGAIRNAIRKSFPGCQWTESGKPGTDAIAIEIHRLASVQVSGGSWEAAAEWSVTVRDAAGSIVTEFAANEEVFRPNYRGSDNEEESLNLVFRQAIERTVKGLSAIRSLSAARPPAGTFGRPARAPALRTVGGLSSWQAVASPSPRTASRPGSRVERKSHDRLVEDL